VLVAEVAGGHAAAAAGEAGGELDGGGAGHGPAAPPGVPPLPPPSPPASPPAEDAPEEEEAPRASSPRRMPVGDAAADAAADSASQGGAARPDGGEAEEGEEGEEGASSSNGEAGVKLEGLDAGGYACVMEQCQRNPSCLRGARHPGMCRVSGPPRAHKRKEYMDEEGGGRREPSRLDAGDLPVSPHISPYLPTHLRA